LGSSIIVDFFHRVLLLFFCLVVVDGETNEAPNENENENKNNEKKKKRKKSTRPLESRERKEKREKREKRDVMRICFFLV
jgi:hypothetical protein|tara:strand:+ start:81 stop:320 length:240 start_codon:yes stop_codon:yes gene_type:complete